MCSKNDIWLHFFQTRWKLISTISVRWKNLNLLFFINEMFLSNTCIWISWRCYLDLIIFKAVIFERSRVSREFSIRYAWLKIMSAFNRVIFYLDLRFNVCINVWEKKGFHDKKICKNNADKFQRQYKFLNIFSCFYDNVSFSHLLYIYLNTRELIAIKMSPVRILRFHKRIFLFNHVS